MNEPMLDLGIPYPIWPVKSSPAEASARTATRQGCQVHAIIARLAHLVPHADDDLVIESTVTAVVAGRENGNLPRARARVSGLVRQYLRVFLPYTATLTGTEVATGNGRADLLWTHPRAGTFYDEVKTGRSPNPLTDATVDQVARYTDAGLTAFPDTFAGVRLITLGNESAALWIAPDGTVAPLRQSPLAPHSLTGRNLP